MKPFFTPEDFPNCLSREMTEIANLANAKLNALIEAAPVVYINRISDGTMNHFTCVAKYANDRPEYYREKARLMFIEEIVKKPCRHEPSDSVKWIEDDSKFSNFSTKCKHCGVELKATWSEVK